MTTNEALRQAVYRVLDAWYWHNPQGTPELNRRMTALLNALAESEAIDTSGQRVEGSADGEHVDDECCSIPPMTDEGLAKLAFDAAYLTLPDLQLELSAQQKDVHETDFGNTVQQQQQPLFWYRPCSNGQYEGPIHNAQIERVRKESGAWHPLYTRQQPAQPQEPVAWMDEFGNVFPLGAQRGPGYLNEPMKPLYTSPQPAQQQEPEPQQGRTTSYEELERMADDLQDLCDKQAIRLGQLEAQQQEPIGFMSPKQIPAIADPPDESGKYIPIRKTQLGNFTLALYTHQQPASKPWVGLTPDEQANLVEEVDWYNFPIDLVKETEAKLREKNGGAA